MPEYKLKVDLETRPQGDEIEVPPYGVVENGGDAITIQATEEEAAIMSGSYGLTVTDSTGNEVPASHPKEEEKPVEPGTGSNASPASPTPTPTTPEGGEE